MKELRNGGFTITKIHQLAGRIFSRLMKKYNLTEINPAQGRILFVLWENDEIPINTLSKKTMLEKSTLTSMLDRLEKDGFLTRTHSKEDRRQIIIKRTEKDKSFQKQYLEISEEMNNLFYKDFNDEDIDKFENYLQRVFSNLLEYDK